MPSALKQILWGATLFVASQATYAQFIIAHRGAMEVAPENTLPALQRAIEMKAQALQIDLQLTSDGHFILMHDDTVDRTTDGRGDVEELTLAQVRALDAGSRFSGGFDITAVPTLEEVLDLERGEVWLIVELTETSEEAIPAEQLLLATLKERQAQNVILKSFNSTQLERMRAIAPEYPQLYVMFGTYPLIGLTIDESVTFRDPLEEPVEWLQWHRSAVNATLVRQAHRRGKKVIAWSVNEDDEILAMIELGVDGIETDSPDRARELWLGQLGIPVEQ